ncbi:DNA internalization-related competence protein ComEC/Rec2 [Cognaticolwellia mytili]|uniref:DNA internalization-related competence protein ComEC/Rec2 n=1 Tax=Cognaticolwellia mytili TaxID=1888913 RepID=UPI001301BFD5|nr:DNA internalization-related competence protein ComEC/Rec2 [Cognaticolwellia mytili]
MSLFIAIVPEFSLLCLILSFSILLLLIKQCRPIGLMLLGACWVLIAANQYQSKLSENNIVLETLQKKTAVIRGAVIDIVHQKPNSNRFNFLVSHWQGSKLKVPFIVRLNWKVPTKKLLQGQQWQLAVKLKPAHGLANVGGFNYQVWLRHKGIVATGYVKAVSLKKIKKRGVVNNILIAEDTSWRQLLYQKFSALVSEKPLGGLLLALGFGERGELTKEQWHVLTTTATIHLIAISGLHIGIIALFSLILARALFKTLPFYTFLSDKQSIRLMRTNVKYLPILVSCFMAWYYAYLAGYSIPTLRALVMLFMFWLLKAGAINVSLIRWLLLTILVILLLWPLSLLSASFWLSISALSIIFATSSRFLSKVNLPDEHSSENKILDTANVSSQYSEHTRWRKYKSKFYHWCKALFVIQLALTVCMLPISALLNYQLPLLAFFANIIAVPLMSMTTIPLTLLAVITLPISEMISQFFLELAHLSLVFIWQWLSYIAEISWAQVSVSNIELAFIFLTVTGAFLMLYFRMSRVYSILIVGFIVTVFSLELITDKTAQHWQLSIFDVGHGLAVVIEKNQRAFIYDTGARYPSGFNMAQAAILPYLKYQGYQTIDGVIISHNDNDHAGGLRYLREQMPIYSVIANDFSLVPNSHCLLGEGFTWQGLHFEMLSPSQLKGDKNDDSCVVVISDGFHRVLLPGDISSKQEKRLLNNNEVREKLASDILIAPHHGSKSSSNATFLSAVAPKYAVFSAGYLNRWKMPSAPILKRYHSQNIETFNTAELGMIKFMFTPLNIKPLSYRKDFKPYWFVN